MFHTHYIPLQARHIIWIALLHLSKNNFILALEEQILSNVYYISNVARSKDNINNHLHTLFPNQTTHKILESTIFIIYPRKKPGKSQKKSHK